MQDIYWYKSTVNCPRNDLNLGIKTESVTTGAYATDNVWFLGRYTRFTLSCTIYIQYVIKSRTNTVASASAMTGSVFMPRFRLFLGQCVVNMPWRLCWGQSRPWVFMRRFRLILGQCVVNIPWRPLLRSVLACGDLDYFWDSVWWIYLDVSVEISLGHGFLCRDSDYLWDSVWWICIPWRLCWGQSWPMGPASPCPPPAQPVFHEISQVLPQYPKDMPFNFRTSIKNTFVMKCCIASLSFVQITCDLPFYPPAASTMNKNCSVDQPREMNPLNHTSTYFFQPTRKQCWFIWTNARYWHFYSSG